MFKLVNVCSKILDNWHCCQQCQCKCQLDWTTGSTDMLTLTLAMDIGHVWSEAVCKSAGSGRRPSCTMITQNSSSRAQSWWRDCFFCMLVVSWKSSVSRAEQLLLLRLQVSILFSPHSQGAKVELSLVFQCSSEVSALGFCQEFCQHWSLCHWQEKRNGGIKKLPVQWMHARERVPTLYVRHSFRCCYYFTSCNPWMSMSVPIDMTCQ